MPIMSAADALHAAQDRLLATRSDVYLMGEGVADPKGIFGTTTGLAQKYGSARVVEMPVAENGLTGIAIGSALMGQRPLMIHQRVDFALLALEQLFNNAGKTHYITQGQHTVPLVVRMIVGRGWGQGPAHSQSLETVFAAVPGLKVVMPTTPEDFHGMLIGAVEDDNPVLMIEHRWLHYVKGEVNPDAPAIPIKGPRKVRSGDKATVVATSYMVLEAQRAVDRLAEAGCDCDFFDLRVIRPLDLEDILASVRRTGRLIVADTGYTMLGVGAEVVSRAVTDCFEDLKARPIRIGLPDHPTPSSAALATAYYPGSLDIARAVADVSELPSSVLAPVLDDLKAERDALPIDQPDPSFEGPF